MSEKLKWKSRHQLPVAGKLSQFRFDPEKLVQAFIKTTQKKQWDGLGNEYSSLCENHTGLPKMFFKESELRSVNHISEMQWDNVSYQQMGITSWDEDFSLEKRNEKSNTAWDSRIAKRNEKADERWFRKRDDDLESYLHEILDTIGEDKVHRARFAKLLPNSKIKPHIDYDTTYGIRIHIPIITNNKCVLGGINKDGKSQEFHMPADGSVWFVNPGLKHWAINNGQSERIHLILSVDSQEILSGLDV